jgi:hypothetical protein
MDPQKLLEILASKQRSFVMSANGSSMVPFLVRGDRLHFERGADVALGDVVLYRSPSGRLLIHRVCSLSPLCTKGDNVDEFDEPGGVSLARLVRVEKTWRSILRRYTLLLWSK